MISLVLIFMMSLMGISSMRSATLDKRMSANAVHKSRSFQAAESITELALNDRDALGTAVTTGTAVTVLVSLNDNEQLVTEATIEYTGLGMVDGWSTTFSGPQFEVVGDANLASVNARSNVIQGAYVPAPAN